MKRFLSALARALRVRQPGAAPAISVDANIPNVVRAFPENLKAAFDDCPRDDDGPSHRSTLRGAIDEIFDEMLRDNEITVTR